MKKLLLSLTLALFAGMLPAIHAATKPNIILVMPDDLG